MAPKITVVLHKIPATGAVSKVPVIHNNSPNQFKLPGVAILATVAKKNHTFKLGIKEPNPLK